MNPALELTWDMFVDSPSRRDGISMELEKHYRATGCEFIGALSARFNNKIRGRIVCHACALYNQFYMRQSFKNFDRWEVAVATLSIATKNKGTTHCLRELIVESLRLWRQRKGLMQEDRLLPDRIKYWESVIFHLELEVLITLNGELGVFIAHACVGGITELVRDANGKALTPNDQKEILKKVVVLFKYSYRSVMTLFYPASWIVAANLYWAIERENKHWQTTSLRMNGHNNNYDDHSHMTESLRPLQLPKDWYKNNKYFATRLDMNVIQYLVNEFKACMTAEENDGIVPSNSFMIINSSQNKNKNKYLIENDKQNKNQNIHSTNSLNINVETKASQSGIQSFQKTIITNDDAIHKNDNDTFFPNTHAMTQRSNTDIVTKEQNGINNSNKSNTQNENGNAKMNADSSTYQRQSTSENHKSCSIAAEWRLFNATNKLHPKYEMSQSSCNHGRKRKLYDMQNESEPKENMGSKGSLEHMFSSPLKKVKTINSLTIEENNTIMHNSYTHKHNSNSNINMDFNNHMNTTNVNTTVGLVSLSV